MSNDLERKVVRTSVWSIKNIVYQKCSYCEKPAEYILNGWFGLDFSRPLCEKHKIEFMLRRKEL